MAEGLPTPTITQLEFQEADFDFAERIARALGYTQTAYTSTSALWGLFCLPDHARHRKGCIIKTKELGFLFVADVEDLQLHALADEQHRAAQSAQLASWGVHNPKRGKARGGDGR
jgi:hypothetical protein